MNTADYSYACVGTEQHHKLHFNHTATKKEYTLHVRVLTRGTARNVTILDYSNSFFDTLEGGEEEGELLRQALIKACEQGKGCERFGIPDDLERSLFSDLAHFTYTDHHGVEEFSLLTSLGGKPQSFKCQVEDEKWCGGLVYDWGVDGANEKLRWLLQHQGMKLTISKA